tara:strand:- start:1124 stop:1552 length:429 start_codon:yes stop_codon:yes gene_type:complete
MIQDKTMMFASKYNDINEVMNSLIHQRYDTYIIDYQITMERALFDSLLCDLFQPFNYFKDKGGYSDKGRHVIKITDKDTGLKLFVDPSGYNYARYVGIEVIDISRFRARYESMNKNELKPIENSTSIEHFTSLRAFDLKHNR